MKIRNRHLLIVDVLGGAVALYFAFSIRFEGFSWPAPYPEIFLRFLPIAAVLRVGVAHRLGLYQRLWRHAGIAELGRILRSALLSGLACAAAGVWLLPLIGLLPSRVPISVTIIDLVLSGLALGAPRFFVRWLATRKIRGVPGGRRVVIAGAGSAGEAVARALSASPALGLEPVGFLDDDEAKHGQTMRDLEVLGPIRALESLRASHQIDEVIIAMPSAPGSAVREALRMAQAAGLPARTIPGMFEILAGRVAISSLRPIQIDDLLRREPVRTDLDRVEEMVADRPVLVTGAGGSIGAELCRQISAFGPRRLIVLGHGEHSIFTVAAELTERFPSLDLVPVIADVRDRGRLTEVLGLHRPDVLFHAAAHKHVPLMELNVAEAITNNVLGTRNVAEVAAEIGCARFVLISSDKAVRPTNVMGATKRVAEQVVQAVASGRDRPFIAVRFGNVLGSRGSVVPIFLRQIEAGGPVTITHPEMRRYFMTIPESVQLVLQAAVQARSGEVFALDMGEPVKILDLATDLIRLSGLTVGRDIEIHFTGVRPGEKLYEELFFGREHAEPTEHPKVLRATHAELATGTSEAIERLVVRAQQSAPDEELRELLRVLVPDYHPEDSAHNVAALRPASLGDRSVTG